ncbi:MAG TPA: hypothetical protein VNT52_00965 [Acidimicrobiales bacterium]|nr:hypothetical protein [Acidimicrobiales bacterium]
MTITATPEPVTIRPARKIGAFSATVTIEEIATDDLEITRHPVQQGAEISDHAFLKPAFLQMRFACDDSERPLSETYDALLKLQASREPFDVVTGKRIYRNMLFASLMNTTDRESENVLAVSAELREVIIVRSQIATVPPRARQKNPGATGGTDNAGAKKAQPSDKEKPKSALRALAG